MQRERSKSCLRRWIGTLLFHALKLRSWRGCEGGLRNLRQLAVPSSPASRTKQNRTNSRLMVRSRNSGTFKIDHFQVCMGAKFTLSPSILKIETSFGATFESRTAV